jgi:hypothetical protein
MTPSLSHVEDSDVTPRGFAKLEGPGPPQTAERGRLAIGADHKGIGRLQKLP